MRKTIIFWRKTFVSFLVFAFLLNNLSAFALKPASSFQIASPTPGAKQFKETLFSDIKFRTVVLSIINHLFCEQLNKETLPKTIRDKFRNSPDFLTGINLEEVYQENDNIYVPYKKSLIRIQLTKSEIPRKTDLTQKVYKGYNIRIARMPANVNAESVTMDYTNVTSEVIQAGGLTPDDLDRQTRVLTSETIKKRLQDSISNGFLRWPDEMLANSGKIDKICKQWERYQDIIILGAPRLAEALVNYHGIKSKYRRLHFIDTLEAEKFSDMRVLPGFSWDKTCVAVISQGAGDIIQKTNLEWLKNKINDSSRIAVIANKENPLLNETNSQNRLITISLKNNENVLNFSGTALALALGLAGINYKEFAGYVKKTASQNINDSAAVKFASVIRALSVKQNHKGEFIDTIMLLSYDKTAQPVIDAAVSSANARLSSIRTYIGSNAPEANHEDYQIAMGKNGTLMALISPEKWTSNQIIPADAKPRWRSTHEENYTTAQFMDVSKKGIKTDLAEFNDHNIDITFTQDLKGIAELVGLFQLAGELDYLAVEEKHIFTESLTVFDDSFAQILNEPPIIDQTYTAVMADGKSVINIGGLIGGKKGCLNKADLDNAFLKVEEAMATVKTGHDVEGKHIYLNEPDEVMTKTEITDSREMAQLASFGKKNIIFLGVGAPHNTIKFGTQPLQGFYANETDNTKVKKVFFGGNTIDPREIDGLLEIIDKEPYDTLIVYTSYSGETAEPDIVFRILLECLIKKAKISSLDDTEAIKHLTQEANYTQSDASLLIDKCIKFAKKENLTLAQYEFIRNHLLFITGKRGSLNTEASARGFRTLRHPLSSGRHAIFTTTVYAMEILGLNADSFIKSGREHVDKIFSEDEKVPLLAKDPGFTAGALTGYLSRVKKRPKIKIVDFAERLASAGVWRDKHMINESLNKPYISIIAESMEISDLLSSLVSLPKDDKSIYVLFSDINKSEALISQKKALLKAVQSFFKNHGIPFLTFQIDTALKEKSHANLILSWEQFVLGYGCTIADAPHGYSADEHPYGEEKCSKARIAVDKAGDEARGRKQAAIDDVVEQFALRDETLIRMAETAVHIGQGYFDNIKGKNLLKYWGRPNAQAEVLVTDTMAQVKDAIANGNIKKEDIRAVITIHPITRVPIINEKDFCKNGRFIMWAMPADNLIEGFNPLSSAGNPGSVIAITEVDKKKATIGEQSISFDNTKLIMEFVHGPGDEPGVMVWAKNEMLDSVSVYSYAKIDGVLVPRVVLKAGSHLTTIPEKRGSDAFIITDSQADLPPAIVSLWNKARAAGIRSRNFRNSVSNIAKLINGGVTEFTTTWFEGYIHAMFSAGMGGKVNIITKDGEVYSEDSLFKTNVSIKDLEILDNKGSKAFQKVVFTAGDPEWMGDLAHALKTEDNIPKTLPDPLWVPDEPEFKPENMPKLTDFLKDKNVHPDLIKITNLWSKASIDFGNEYKKITMLKPIGTANIASEIQYLADIKADEIYHEIFSKNHDLVYVSVSEERQVTRYDKEALFASYCDPVDGVKNLLQGFVTGNIEAITFKDGSGGIFMQLLQGANILIFSDDSGTYSAIWDGKDFRVMYEYEYADPAPCAISNIAVGGADSKYKETQPEMNDIINILLKNGYKSDNAYGMLIDTARILDRSRNRIFKHKLSSIEKNAGIYKLEPLEKEISGGLLKSGGYLYGDMGGAVSRPEMADLGGKMRLTELIAQCKEIAKVKRSKTGRGLGWHFGTNKNLDRIIVAYNDENLPQLSYPCFLGVNDGLLNEINKILWGHYVKCGFASVMQAVTCFENYDVKKDPDYEEAPDIDPKGRVFRLKKNPHIGMIRILELGGSRSYPVHGRVECLDVEAIFDKTDLTDQKRNKGTLAECLQTIYYSSYLKNKTDIRIKNDLQPKRAPYKETTVRKEVRGLKALNILIPGTKPHTVRLREDMKNLHPRAIQEIIDIPELNKPELSSDSDIIKNTAEKIEMIIQDSILGTSIKKDILMTSGMGKLETILDQYRPKTLQHIVKRAVINVENWQAKGKLGYRALPDQPEKLLQDIENHAKARIESGITDIVLIGIGGQFATNKTLQDSLTPVLYNLSIGFRGMRPRIHMLGNIDQYALHAYLERNNLNPQTTDICISSKSGDTIETLVNAYFFINWIVDRLGENEAMKHIAVLTNDETPVKGRLGVFFKLKPVKWFYIPTTKEDVPGRYSALSPSGLITMAYAGFNIRELLRGAGDIKKTLQKVPKEGNMKTAIKNNKALLVALYVYYHLRRGEKDILAVSTFSERLRTCANLLKQLFGESDGKDGKGIFPCIATGSETADELASTAPDKIFFLLNYLPDFVKMPVFTGHPYISLNIRKLDEYTLGQLIFLCEDFAVWLGALLNFDPLIQPKVQLAKDITQAELEAGAPEEKRALTGIYSTGIEGLLKISGKTQSDIAKLRRYLEQKFPQKEDNKIDRVLPDKIQNMVETYIQSAEEKIKNGAADFIIIGTRPALLKMRAIYQAKTSPMYKIKMRERKGHPRVYFIDETKDETLKEILSRLKPKTTVVQILHQRNLTGERDSFIDVLESHFENYPAHILPSYDFEETSKFYGLNADEIFFCRMIGIKKDEILEFIQGYGNYSQDMAMDLAIYSFLLYTHTQNASNKTAKKTLNLIFSYSEQLLYFNSWVKNRFRHKFSELGYGPTFETAVGSTDQHSILEGMLNWKNKIFTIFIRFDKTSADFTAGKGNRYAYDLVPEYMKNKTLQELITAMHRGVSAALTNTNRPNITINAPELNAAYLGSLFALFENMSDFEYNLLLKDMCDKIKPAENLKILRIRPKKRIYSTTIDNLAKKRNLPVSIVNKEVKALQNLGLIELTRINDRYGVKLSSDLYHLPQALFENICAMPELNDYEKFCVMPNEVSKKINEIIYGRNAFEMYSRLETNDSGNFYKVIPLLVKMTKINKYLQPEVLDLLQKHLNTWYDTDFKCSSRGLQILINAFWEIGGNNSGEMLLEGLKHKYAHKLSLNALLNLRKKFLFRENKIDLTEKIIENLFQNDYIISYSTYIAEAVKGFPEVVTIDLITKLKGDVLRSAEKIWFEKHKDANNALFFDKKNIIQSGLSKEYENLMKEYYASWRDYSRIYKENPLSVSKTEWIEINQKIAADIIRLCTETAVDKSVSFAVNIDSEGLILKFNALPSKFLVWEMHDDLPGMINEINVSDEFNFYSKSVRGFVSQPLESEDGYIRLDIFETGEIETVEKVAEFMLKNSANGRKEIKMRDSLRKRFENKYKITLPEIVTLENLVKRASSSPLKHKPLSVTIPDSACAQTVLLAIPEGLHGRTSAKIVDISNAYPETNITIFFEGKTAKGNSIVQLLALAAEYGEEILIITKGPDEQKAINFIAGILQPDKQNIEKEMKIIHEQNLKLLPPVETEKTLWHVIPIDLIPFEIRSSFCNMVYQTNRNYPDLREKTKIVTEEQNLKDAIAALTNNPNNIVDLAARDIKDVENLPYGVKALIFEGKLGNFRQLEGILAALRALHQNNAEALINLYELLTKNKFEKYTQTDILKYIDNPKKLSEIITFKLPYCEIEDFRTQNTILLTFIQSA